MPLWGEPSLPLCEDWYARTLSHHAALRAKLPDGFAAGTVTYQNSRGDLFSDPIEEILAHLFMHSSQYRGEAAGALNQTIHRVPDLDLLFWGRIGEPE